MRRVSFVLFASLILTIAACGGSEDTATDNGVEDNVVEDNGSSEEVTAASCFDCLAVGQTFRFTMLDVLEPDEPVELPNFLNNIWAPDINDDRLNILLQIEEVINNEDGTLSMTFSAGSGWHDMTLNDLFEVDGGSKASYFYFIGEEYKSPFTVTVKPDCTFEMTGNTMLLFHPGTMENGLICSAENANINQKADAIPIRIQQARGTISGDCQQIESSYLQGCIAVEAACEICSFSFAPYYDTLERDPDETVTAKPCTADYCEAKCGHPMMWVNFGAFVDGIGVPKGCDVDEDGTPDAYRIAGNWAAKQVVYQEPATE